MYARRSLSWNVSLLWAHTFSLKARKEACDTAGGFRSFQPSPLFSPVYREAALPLTCTWHHLSVYSLQSSRDQPVGTRGQDHIPPLHPPWSSHTLCCCALWSTPGPWSLWSYGWIFCCSLRTSRESQGKRAALSVPFCQQLASKIAPASLCLRVLASQNAVIPSLLSVWYLGKILRWESNSWVSNGHCYTLQGLPHAVWLRDNSSSPTASGLQQPQDRIWSCSNRHRLCGWAQPQVRPDCR